MSTQLNDAVQNFISTIEPLLRQKFVEELRDSLQGTQGRKVVRGNRAPKSQSKPKRVRRTQSDIDGVKEKIIQFLTKNPSSSMEDISDALKTASKNLRLPLGQLRDEKAVSIKGNKRAAVYAVK